MDQDKVKQFLNDVESMDPEKFRILQKIRQEIKELCMNVTERMMYGGIMFSFENRDFGGVFLRKKHVSLEFGEGYLMDDPKAILEGSGKYRRHIKIRDYSDLTEKDVSYFLRQVVK